VPRTRIEAILAIIMAGSMVHEDPSRHSEVDGAGRPEQLDDAPAAEGGDECPPRTTSRRPVRRQLVLQDVLLDEGLLAVRLSADAKTPDRLRALLLDRLPQNSAGTRERYALSVLRWFFPDGPGGIARQAWEAYEDEAIERDILRVLYLRAEPLVGGCIADALFPLAEGMQVPPAFFDRYLVERLETPDVPGKTRERLKQNLGKLGFLARSRGATDRLAPIVPTKTAFLVLLHHLFAPDGPRTVELAHLFADPFWKYLGLKSEDAVRAILREADRVRWIGKYVVADQLEQLTTCFSLAELLRKKALL
jgi:hypothetical protein